MTVSINDPRTTRRTNQARLTDTIPITDRAAFRLSAGVSHTGLMSLAPRHAMPLMSTGLVEPVEDRDDLLSIFGIWVQAINSVDQREVFGTQLFLPFFYPLGEFLKFLVVFLL